MQEIATRYVNILHYKTTNAKKLLYILEQRSSWSTSWIRPSWPCSGLKLSPILASPYEHASCYCAQPSILLFIATVQVSHLVPSAIWVASHYYISKHHNNATRHKAHMYIQYITSALLFISSSYTSSILLGRLAVPNPSCRLQVCYIKKTKNTSYLWLLDINILYVNN
jgi:hypothetical protein